MSELLSYDWEPPIEDTYLALSAVAEELENMTDFMFAARGIAVKDTEQHFEQEVDPYGKAWEPLTEGYAKAKAAAGYPDNILVRTEALKTAALDEANWDVVGGDLVFRADDMPEYGYYHQFGAPDRSRGGPLAKRQFIGLSEEAMLEISALFELKLERAQEVWINPTGFAYTRAPAGTPGGAGGQFTGGFRPEV